MIMMNKKHLTALSVLLICALTGCGLMEDTLIVPHDHSYSGQIKAVSQYNSGEKPWKGSDSVVVSSSEFKKNAKITAKSALLVNIDDVDALWGKDIYKELNPGELTQLFTAYMVLQKKELSDMVTVTSESSISATGYASIGLEVGDRFTVEELLYAMIVGSCVDAANALAVEVSGSVSAFVEEMNETLVEIGCVDTKLVNANGYYSASQTTTTYDLYLVLKELLKDQRFETIFTAKSHKGSGKDLNGDKKRFSVSSPVSLLKKNESQIGNALYYGGCSGSSSFSGQHLLVCAKNSHDKTFVGILLSTSDSAQLYKQMRIILKKIKD